MARVGALEKDLREIELRNTFDEKIELETKPLYSVFKRMSDIVLSLTALILLSPFLLIISLLIMVEDRHSPFYVQSRVGLNGKSFNIYKFRTMRANSDSLRDELK